MATGGDVLEITFDNPNIGSGSFFPISNQGNTFKPGGIMANDDANQVTASGTMINQLNRTLGHFEVLCENDMNLRDDISVAQALAGDTANTDFTISLNNKTVWTATGRPVGELTSDVNASSFTLKINAPVWEKIIG